MKAFRFSRETILLSGILVLAFVLRVWGVQFGLPFLYHADEPIVVNHALAFGTGDLNPHFFKIPPLVSYLLFLCYGLYYVVGLGLGLFHSAKDFETLFFFDPSSFYLIARFVFGVLLGTASVYGIYRLVKGAWNAQAALWSSLFLAVNFLHARDSHYIYADIPLVFVLLLGMTVILNGEKNLDSGASGSSSLTMAYDWKYHLLSGAVIGLAVATKYNGVFLAIPYLWICFRRVSWKQWPVCGCLAAFTAGAVFVLLNPYAVLDHAFFAQQLAEQSEANAGGFSVLHHLTYSLAGALGWPMILLAILGTLFSKDVRSEAVAIFVIGYYVVLCRFGQPYDRYVLPLIPFMVILAAQWLLALKEKSRLFFWILIPFVILPSVIKTIHWDRLMSEPDVRTVAKEWVEAHIPSGSRLALDSAFFMPRLEFSPAQLEDKRARSLIGFHPDVKIRRLNALLSKPYRPSYDLYFLASSLGGPVFLFSEPLVPFNVNTLRQSGIEYVLLSDTLIAQEGPFFDELQRNADRIMSFSPYRDSGDLTRHDPQTMTGGPFLWRDILPRARGGNPIALYRIRS